MPIYEYQCQACHKLFEYIQKVNDALLTDCEQCHGKLEKLVSSTSFQLKGTGWYVTDFKNADKKPAETTANPHAKSASNDKKITQESQNSTIEKEPAKKPATESTSTTKE